MITGLNKTDRRRQGISTGTGVVIGVCLIQLCQPLDINVW